MSRPGAALPMGLALLVLALAIMGLTLGDYPLPLSAILATLAGGGEGVDRFILLDLRLPRVLTGALAGAAFGLSGALFQSITRNPLASPDIIGFNAGAALGAVAVIAAFGTTIGWAVTLGALGGGLLAAVLVVATAWRGGLQAGTIVLAGIGIGFTAFAGVDFLLTRGSVLEAGAIVHWLTGSLLARDHGHVVTAALGLVLFATPLMLLRDRLTTLELGDEAATGIGLDVIALRAGAAGLGIGLIGTAIAVAGPVPFVAFVAGPLARRISGRAGPNLPLAALIGAAILLAADLAGRLAFAPTELPAGTFTAVFGAPYLLWLLWRQIQSGEI